MPVSGCLAVLFSIGAVAADIRTDRVDNRLILSGWAAGCILQIISSGVRGAVPFLAGSAIPLLLLFPLFLFRMMGAGDIKLLSVLGGLLGCRGALACIFWSLICGACLALVIIRMEQSLLRRFRCFIRYIHRYMQTRQRIPYRDGDSAAMQMHFTVPVLMSVLLITGGVVG